MLHVGPPYPVSHLHVSGAMQVPCKQFSEHTGIQRSAALLFV